MLSSLYKIFFAKDKPFRHYTQHFVINLFGYIIIINFLNVPSSLSTSIFYFLFTYLIDLDGFFSLFLTSRHIPESKAIRVALSHFQLTNAATLGTIHHKKFNRLLLHNIFGFTLFTIILVLALYNQNTKIVLAISAILFHFIFDIADDIYQLGHIHNWLWPIKKMLHY